MAIGDIYLTRLNEAGDTVLTGCVEVIPPEPFECCMYRATGFRDGLLVFDDLPEAIILNIDFGTCGGIVPHRMIKQEFTSGPFAGAIGYILEDSTPHPDYDGQPLVWLPVPDEAESWYVGEDGGFGLPACLVVPEEEADGDYSIEDEFASSYVMSFSYDGTDYNITIVRQTGEEAGYCVWAGNDEAFVASVSLHLDFDTCKWTIAGTILIEGGGSVTLPAGEKTGTQDTLVGTYSGGYTVA